jgi:PIN domain
MPGYFFDSSALGKRYHQEVGSTFVEALFQVPQPARFISRLSVVELQSVFAGKVRTRVIVEADLEPLRARFPQDISRRELRVIRMTDGHCREAERLIQQHGISRGLRTLDALVHKSSR